MIKKTFKATEEQEEQLNKLQEFFNEKTHQRTMNRVLSFCVDHFNISKTK